jgi:hypothetical protein
MILRGILHTYIYTYIRACMHTLHDVLLWSVVATCIHVYIYIHIHIYIYIYIYVYVYIRLEFLGLNHHDCIHTYIYMHTMWVCMYVHICITDGNICAKHQHHINTRIHACMHACLHGAIHICVLQACNTLDEAISKACVHSYSHTYMQLHIFEVKNHG